MSTSPESTAARHQAQQSRATTYKPIRPDLPTDFKGGGPLTGPGAVPPPPPGTEAFVSQASPPIYWSILAAASVTFIALTIGSKVKSMGLGRR